MAADDTFDLNAILSSLYRVGPTDEEKRRAASQAFARMGLGILAANQPSREPRNALGVLAQGGLGGMDTYQADLDRQMAERKANAGLALTGLQLKKQLDQQEALKGLFSASKPMPLGPQAMNEGAAVGDIGPTQTNLARLHALERNPVAQTYTPVSLDKVGAAAASGVDINPFLKLNEAARPDVLQIDLGDKIRLVDKRTLRVLGETPKGSAPASVPFEAKDLPPSGYRDFLLSKGRAGASQQITNVNAFTPASEEAQRDFIKSTRATYDALKQAPVALASIEKAKALIPEARGFMGPGGEGLLDAAKFLNNRLGMSISTEGIKSAEELRTRIFFNIMDNLKKMDAQPSQMQQQIMMESLGKLGTDPNALPRVLDAFADVIKGKVELHNREVRGAIQRGVKFPYDPIISSPNIKRYNPATE